MSNFRRRLMMNFEKKYTPVKYLESTGTQYIDTDVIFNINCEINSKFLFTNNVNNNNVAIYGLKQASSSGTISFNIIPYNSNVYTSFGNQIDIKYLKDDTFTNASNYLHNKSGLWVDGVKKISYNNVSVGSNNLSIYLFARNNNGSFDRPSWAKIYYLKIFDNNNLVRDYIPVLDSSNRPCLFDKVEKKFYYNQGTGEFLYE